MAWTLTAAARVAGLLHLFGVFGVLHLAGGALTGSPGPMAAAALAAVALLAAFLVVPARAGRHAAWVSAQARSAALRRRARGTAFLPQRDPDAAGRPRPRAPARRPAAA